MRRVPVDDPKSSPRLVTLAISAVVVLAVYNNLIVTRLPGLPASYVPANVAAAVVAVVAARWAGLHWADLGLSRAKLGRGLRWGGVAAGLVAAGYALALLLPGLRPLLRDERFADFSASDAAYHGLVRVPLATVLWEEIAFRGVLLGVLLRLMPVRAAVAACSALFGLWHIRPTLSAPRTRSEMTEALGPVLLTCGAVVGTALAGVLFCWLRLRTGSLAAPALLHLATNSLGPVAVMLAGAER